MLSKATCNDSVNLADICRGKGACLYLAANYISMLAGRKHIDPRELEFAVDVYGKNFSCYSLLQEIAEKNDIYIQNHPVTDALRGGVRVCEECNRHYAMKALVDPNRTPEVIEQLYFTSVDGAFFGKDLG